MTITTLITLVFLAYVALLFIFSWVTSRKSGNQAYFIGNRKSPWYIVAYGMIGASLSGVTFISIPGWVGQTQFTYLMVVFGYFFGYMVIALVLLPIYYKFNLVSIYSYLNTRFGQTSQKTGALFFILSRLIGASFRMFLVINVLHMFIFSGLGWPFWTTALLFIIIITLYSFRGGIRTIVWTDTLQTTFMLAALVVTFYMIGEKLGIHMGGLLERAINDGYTRLIEDDWRHDRFFLKQFFSGMFITIVMTGLDQDMMQKNLSCRSLREAQKNVFSLGALLIPVNILFLFLGASLYIYANDSGIIINFPSDELFPRLAIEHFGGFAAVVFFLGLIAAAFSSADGAITALTTSTIYDIIGFKDESAESEITLKRLRYLIHFFISSLIILINVLFRNINDKAVIDSLFTIAGYTYGPLLGLYACGIFTQWSIKDRLVPIIAVAAPLLTWLLNRYSTELLFGYQFGFELLILNGALMIAGLWLIRKPQQKQQTIQSNQL
ncbi:MAG TPA: sodium:solute symporter [Bacteroidales bacterium]|nr:sodium:solute symporter [Bacteroidales bacterium]